MDRKITPGPIIRVASETQQIEWALKPRIGLSGTATLILPPDWRDNQKGYPLIVRIGHPWVSAKREIEQLRELYSRLPVPCIMARTGIIDFEANLESPPGVDRDDIWEQVAPAFPRLIQQIQSEFPVATGSICFTGFSHDGVWAWMLGLAYPEHCDAIVAMSTQSRFPRILNQLKRGKNIKTIVVRAQFDHAYPEHFYTEAAVAKILRAQGNGSKFLIIPDRKHGYVGDYTEHCLARWLSGLPR